MEFKILRDGVPSRGVLIFDFFSYDFLRKF